MKKWLAAQPAAMSMAGLQRQLDRFTRYYNTVRPHRALDLRTPLQAYHYRPKAVPAGPVIPAHYRVRHDRIDRWGAVTIRHNSRLHTSASASGLAGTPVSLLIDNLHIAEQFLRAEAWERAADYLLRAGDEAARLSADAEARGHYDKAMNALVLLPDTVETAAAASTPPSSRPLSPRSLTRRI